MNRRVFLKTTAITAISLGFDSYKIGDKTHILTFSFDDGFKKSFYKIADIFEANGLSACFNVIASGHLPTFKRVDDWILPELLGNFDDWNTLKSRGHEIMPHSWKHLNLAQQPLNEGKELITKCLDYFESNLEGYKNSEAVFNFPFNSSTPELEEFTLNKVLAVRSSGESAIQGLPKNADSYITACITFGPNNIDAQVEKYVNMFLESSGGWMILNTHGLDNEGWGPMSEKYLAILISRLNNIEKLEILPTGVVLNRAK